MFEKNYTELAPHFQNVHVFTRNSQYSHLSMFPRTLRGRKMSGKLVQSYLYLSNVDILCFCLHIGLYAPTDLRQSPPTYIKQITFFMIW